ncbi:hypothetical protein P691DRAFT_797639 [Macrolepiota fuliginosa MF-IS2]|uniref:Uncharacterized protein n=1 Tax=Macrolepiota fuliginosa MF-IS2 TaxID=1400762 RepID=A0A9P5X338_9AGAR|nr:hypothetical protein P691DRAFT_797639 [Macrolepiota fuliginosa MF-IS2]
MVSDALTHACDQPTIIAYNSHLQSYVDFCKEYNLNPYPSEQQLARYIVYMCDVIKPPTVETYLSGNVYRLQPFYPDIKSNRDSDSAKQVLKGCGRLKSTTILHKLPLSFAQVENISTHYRANNTIDDNLFLAILTGGFFGLLRIGEITDPDDPLLTNRKKITRRNSFITEGSAPKSAALSHKTNLKRNRRSSYPVVNIARYVLLRDRRFPDADWLWLTSRGVPPSRTWFLYRFHQFFPKESGGHSLRAGGATLLARYNYDFNSIQALASDLLYMGCHSQ